MSGCGVRSCRRWLRSAGILEKQKQNKNIPFDRASKGAITFRNSSSRKHNHFPFCSGLNQWFKSRVMDGSKATVVKTASRSQGCLLSQITLQAAPSKRQEVFSPLRKLFSSGEAATAARPSAVTGCGRQRRHLSSETAGRAEHWNVINCSDWNFARTPRLKTCTYRGEKKSFNELRKKRSKNYIKTDSTTYPAVAYFSREWLDGRRKGKWLGLLEFWLSTVWMKSLGWLCLISKNLPPPRMIIKKQIWLGFITDFILTSVKMDNFLLWTWVSI